MTGLLIINLGSPEAPTEEAVRSYLDEFLMDPYVVDIPYPFRWFLVRQIILRKRPAQSAHAYKKIWSQEGSPLLIHTRNLCKKLKHELQGAFARVDYAMRYGTPSIRSALEAFKEAGVFDLRILPLYPQYSLAATESAIQTCLHEAKKLDARFRLSFKRDFFSDELFLEAFAERIRNSLNEGDWDFVLFSYHGLPERQIKRLDKNPTPHCFATADCCSKLKDENRFCYRAQCFATTQALVQRLGLLPEKYKTSFQSRLGRSAWIRPYTDELLVELAQSGIKNLVITCPAFVADCLETLEEISMRAKEDFKAAGGESLRLVPSLNDESSWVKALTHLSQDPDFENLS